MTKAVACRVFVLLAVFFLSACIDVEDFGAYWDKGVIDPALAGRWKKIGARSGEDLKKTPGADEYRFINQGKALLLEAYNDGRKEDDSELSVKTLKIKSYRFIMAGPKKGFLCRYRIDGDVLKGYSLGGTAMLTFLEKHHYLTAKNLIVNRDNGNITIKTFDKEVYRILSEIPDTKAYWTLDNQYRKLPGAK